MMAHEVRIRPLSGEDAVDLYRVRLAPEVMRQTLALPSLTLDRWRREVESMVVNPRNHCLVAIVEGEVVGAVNLEVGHGRRGHGAALGIMVRDDVQARGIGGRLLDAALRMADDWLDVRRIELEVFSDHTVAIEMYERRGFVREGVKVGAAYRDGADWDVVMMGRRRPDGRD